MDEKVAKRNACKEALAGKDCESAFEDAFIHNRRHSNFDGGTPGTAIDLESKRKICRLRNDASKHP